MPQKLYQLDDEGNSRLLLRWRLDWREVVVLRDGHTIGRFERMGLLEEGREFTIPEGRIRIQLLRDNSQRKLRVLLNGTELQSLSSDPELTLGKSVAVLLFTGSSVAALGLLSTLFQVDFLHRQGFNLVFGLVGLLFILLGLLVKHRSRHALGFAIGIIALDALQLLYQAFESADLPLGSLTLRVLLLFLLGRGFSALRKLEALKQESGTLND